MRAVWLDPELLGQHVHVKVYTGDVYGQDDVADPSPGQTPGKVSSPGLACERMIMREDDWPVFVKAMAIGGWHAGLRVHWRELPDSLGRRRYLWNAHPDAPAVWGSLFVVPWEAEQPVT